MWASLALRLTACCLVVGRAQEVGNIVRTTCGDVRGTIRSTTTGSVIAYLGIPFAEPPVGKRRFGKPTQKKPWKGVLNATSLPPLCPQIPVRINNHFAVPEDGPFSEDCLFLNVFKPVRSEDSTLKPVIVYVPGGGFTFGGISLKIYDPSELAVRGDLVVVTIAYRVAPFGFLYLGTEDAPGNMGLYDQQLAMRWVKDNALSFGGDPDVITAMGQSAGAISLGIHLLSPTSAGLFQRVYMQSGSPFIRAFLSRPARARKNALMLADSLDCRQRDSRELSMTEVVACLQSVEVDDILEATKGFEADGLSGFFPVLGDDFVPGSPRRALKTVAPNARDVLVSICAAEGDFVVEHIFKNINNIVNVDVASERYMTLLVRLLIGKFTSADTEPVIERYFGQVTAKKGVQVARAAADVLGDFFFSCPAFTIARGLAAANTSVHVLVYDEKFSLLDWPEWIRSTHSDDLVFSLGSALVLGGRPSDADVKATENLINVVSTFSRTGVPKVMDGTEWPRFDEEGQYLHIQNGRSVQKKHFLESTCNFWDSILAD
ncbi:hypothetical protein HPB50_021161 [Hyalomma asiaticum]|uniref:Uncharacterized protein n=1 Tax=Hyalomma asiaticum TaxID=266040 RepID=A0ACB7SB18_HYAAI|nr:hypothetical protein HPB50_021161 [Hyalomma asiaticum]